MIDRALAAFLESGLSVYVGARDAALQPSGTRATAVTVSPDGQFLDVYLPEVAAARVTPSLQSNGQIAVSFARPQDDRACQVKGTVLDMRAAQDGERRLVAEQWDGFMRQLELIGIPRAVAAGWTSWPAMALRVKVTAVFEQTPGPQAGTPLA